MYILPEVEKEVRKAMRGVIQGDEATILEAMDALQENGGASEAMNMFFFACGAVVNDAHPEGWSDKELEEVAQIVLNSSEELDLFDKDDQDDRTSIVRLLRSAALGAYDPNDLDLADLVVMLPVVSAILVAASSTDNQTWYENLNEIWEAYQQWEPDQEEVDFRAYHFTPDATPPQ